MICWTGIDATPVNFGDFAERSCDLDSFCTPDDTCAAWSKRPNEEANPKESLCVEDSVSAPSEARGFQTHWVTKQGFRHPGC